MLQPSLVGGSTPDAAWYSACGGARLRPWSDRVVSEADVLSSSGECTAQVFMDDSRVVFSDVLKVALASPAVPRRHSGCPCVRRGDRGGELSSLCCCGLSGERGTAFAARAARHVWAYRGLRSW